MRNALAALGLQGGGSFGYNRQTKEHAKRLAAQQNAQQAHEAGIGQRLYQPEPDEKQSLIQQLLDKLRGRS